IPPLASSWGRLLAGTKKMTLNDEVNLLLAIAGLVLIARLRRQWKRMNREERESEIERVRLLAPLLVPLIATVYFTWKVVRGSGGRQAGWIAGQFGAKCACPRQDATGDCHARSVPSRRKIP